MKSRSSNSISDRLIEKKTNWNFRIKLARRLFFHRPSTYYCRHFGSGRETGVRTTGNVISINIVQINNIVLKSWCQLGEWDIRVRLTFALWWLIWMIKWSELNLSNDAYWTGCLPHRQRDLDPWDTMNNSFERVCNYRLQRNLPLKPILELLKQLKLVYLYHDNFLLNFSSKRIEK